MLQFLPLLSVLLVHVCIAEKRGFGAGYGGNQFQTSFRDADLIDWKNVFHKRGGQIRFGDFNAGALDRNDMMDWASRYSKRNFGADAAGLGENNRHFVNWNDYFGKRSRVRRAAVMETAEKRFGESLFICVCVRVCVCVCVCV